MKDKKIKVTLEQTHGGAFLVTKMQNAIEVRPFRNTPVILGELISPDKASVLCDMRDVEVIVHAFVK